MSEKEILKSSVDKYAYSLAELAELWGVTENEIINLAALKEVCLSVNITMTVDCLKGNPFKSIGDPEYDFIADYLYEHLPPIPMEGRWNLLVPAEIAGFLPDNEGSLFTVFRNPKNNTYKIPRVPEWLIEEIKKIGYEGDDEVRIPFYFHRKDLLIMGEDAEDCALRLGIDVKANMPSAKNAGRKTSDITQAVKIAFDYFKVNNPKLIEKGQVKAFLSDIQRMIKTERKDLKNDYEKNVADELRELITHIDVYPDSPAEVTTADRIEPYNQARVSTELTNLRKEDVKKNQSHALNN